MNEFELEHYLNIAAIVDELEQRKRETRLSIYNQTLATHVVYDELGMHTNKRKKT